MNLTPQQPLKCRIQNLRQRHHKRSLLRPKEGKVEREIVNFRENRLLGGLFCKIKAQRITMLHQCWHNLFESTCLICRALDFWKRFLIEYSNNLSNQLQFNNKRKRYNEPIRNQRKIHVNYVNSGKNLCANHDWIWRGFSWAKAYITY